MIRPPKIVILAVVMLLLTATSRGASLSYNPITTSFWPNDIRAAGRLIIWDGSLNTEVVDSHQLLQANFVQAGEAHNWGSEANTSPSQDDLSAKGTSYVTVDADGPAAVRVQFSSSAHVLTENANPNGRQGDAFGGVRLFLFLNVDDLVPGESYNLEYDWLAQASADSPAQPFFGTSGSQANMGVTALGPSQSIFNLPLFDLSVLDVIQGPIQQLDTTGSGSRTFVAPATHVDMYVVIGSSSQVSLGFNPSDVDSVATNFYGEARFAVLPVPEPNSITLLVIGYLLIATVNRLHAR